MEPWGSTGAAGRPGACRRCRAVRSARPKSPAPSRIARPETADTPPESMRTLGAGPLLDRPDDLAGTRETAGLLLGEDQLIADRDLEDASVAPDQLGLDAELLLELVRQTGGTGVVVSDGAVLDDDVSGHPLLAS